MYMFTFYVVNYNIEERGKCRITFMRVTQIQEQGINNYQNTLPKIITKFCSGMCMFPYVFLIIVDLLVALAIS